MRQLKSDWTIEFKEDDMSGLSDELVDIISQEITEEIDKDIAHKLYMESTKTYWYEGTWMNSPTVLFDKVIE